MATNYVSAKYTEVIDLQTSSDKVTVIGIHTPIGSKPRRMLSGLFQQFRKFRYNGISRLTMVPAAQLPIDPLGVSGIPGTTDVMDPRDALNPIMFHGCMGDDLNQILNMIYKEGRYSPFTHSTESADLQEYQFGGVIPGLDLDQFYYSALSDRSWKKFGIQSGVKLRSLRPLVHKVALTKQMIPTSQGGYVPAYGPNIGKLLPSNVEQAPATGDVSPGPFDPVGIVQSGNISGDPAAMQAEYNVNQMFTNGVTPLGWLPTTSWFNKTGANASFAPAAAANLISDYPGASSYATTFLPKAFMGVIMMPPSYKVEQYFRCVIEHSFSFKDFTTSLDPSLFSYAVAYSDFIDHGDSKTEVKSMTVDDLLEESSQLSTLDVIDGECHSVTEGVS